MSEQVKFSDEELNSIKELSKQYTLFKMQFGQLSRLKIQEQIKI